MVNKQNISELLQEKRKAKSIGLYDAALAAGVSPSYLWRIEAGERHPSARFLHRIAPVLGCTDAELLVSAGFLPEEANDRPITAYPGLDRDVAVFLSREPPDIQQHSLTILRFLKQFSSK